MPSTALSRYYYEQIGLEHRARIGRAYVAAGYYIIDRDMQRCLCFCQNRSLAAEVTRALNAT
jgi:hypothetical protein